MEGTQNNVKRVIFKVPGMLFFRRCFLVKQVWQESCPLYGSRWIVSHGVRGRLRTQFAADGAVVRFVYKRGSLE